MCSDAHASIRYLDMYVPAISSVRGKEYDALGLGPSRVERPPNLQSRPNVSVAQRQFKKRVNNDWCASGLTV